MKKKNKPGPKKTKKSLNKPKNIVKQKKITKKHILDDIDDVQIIDMTTDLEPGTEIQDTSSDDEVVDDVETVNAIADPLETIEDLETFNLSGSTGDGEGQLETIRSNPKPKPGWADKVKPKFSPGDLVVPIELSKKAALEFEPWKIVCAYVHKESYSVKKSRVLSEVVMYGDEIKLAPKNGKPFVNHWEANDPFKVAGVKITCPSNNK
jgi:hypothetical protein